MKKGKIIFAVLAFTLITVNQAMAGGDVDVDLRCRSPSQSIVRAIGNHSYGGEEKRYDWSYGHQIIGYTETGYVNVLYRDVKPYVLRDDLFRANPNYYRIGMSGSGSEGWWIFADSDSADFPPRQYHQYATPTTNKNSAVTGTYYGQIKLTYKRYDGTTGEKIINVQIQKRECEAYNNGKWREVSPGRWEQQ
ncbi:MAG: hypothetical protein LBL44_05435 [Treponema sp.]|jgi:hypothetical protein|nr:hypothetical protein [Treponema sp.]